MTDQLDAITVPGMKTLALPYAPTAGPDGSRGVLMFFTHGTAEEVAQDWAARLGQSSQKMQAGAQRVQTAPGQTAANKIQKWINALSDPAVQQKWQRNVGAVSLNAWQDAYVNVGIPRVAQGAQAKIQKYATAMAPLLRFIDQTVAQVHQMDDSTYAAREARMLTFVRTMRGYQKPAGA